MQHLQNLLGQEVELGASNQAVRDFARSQGAATVGAVHVFCSDECEREATDSFQHCVVDPLLPELKLSVRSPFRSANLGARYEWGAARVAEEHFAIPAAEDDLTLLLVKINSHVAVASAEQAQSFGQLSRYGTPSTCCGALGALLAGARNPSLDEMRRVFSYDGVPRLEMLRDPDTVPVPHRSLLAATVNARLQARSAIVDMQDHVPKKPTMTVVIPTVTINRPERDSEYIVGLYWMDSRTGAGEAEYIGLGDHPDKYVVTGNDGQLRVDDGQLHRSRPARNHRQLMGRQLPEQQPHSIVLPNQLQSIVGTASPRMSDNRHLARETFRRILSSTAEIAPTPLAMLLFANGIAGIHHLYAVHRLARGGANNEEARRIITEASDGVSALSAERCQQAIEAITSYFRT